jgi:hypothetical protein
MYRIVPATSIDQDCLLSFAQVVWPERSRERVLSSWWRYAPPECAVAAVYGSTAKMAGICCGRPCHWTIAGRAYPGTAICEWYIDPADSGQGIGKRLVQHFNAAGNFLYTFVISEAAAANFHKLGWSGPYRAPLLVLPMPQLARVALTWRKRPNNLTLRQYTVTSELSGGLATDLDAVEASRSGTDNARPHMRRDANEWSWKLRLSQTRYRFCVAYRDGKPVGYVTVRLMRTESTELSSRVSAALIADLVSVNDDESVLRELALQAVSMSAELGARVVVDAATVKAPRDALIACGFLSKSTPLLGRLVASRSPLFMWLPEGPGAPVVADALELSFADSDADLNL